MSPLALSTATLLLTLDLVGTFVFALSGAAAGVKKLVRTWIVRPLKRVLGADGA